MPGSISQYIEAVIASNQYLHFKGISQQRQSLILPSIPLAEIFIHLRVISDRPLYDVPETQKKQLEEIRQNPDLSKEEREQRIQNLRVIWYSQTGQDPIGTKVAFEEVIQPLAPTSPVAIILGAPASGKSTLLRWLALQAAHAWSSPTKQPPPWLSFNQVPILLKISEYATWLAEAAVPLKEKPFEQFLLEHLTGSDPHLPETIENYLANGQCLFLFDGLDEVTSDELRRAITEHIREFIDQHTTALSAADSYNYNRFIVTSRIVGYESNIFDHAHYTHYTVLELRDEQIEPFLSRWCPAVERSLKMSSRSKQPLSQQIRQANEAGIRQRDLLLEDFKLNPALKNLARNPLMLTLLASLRRGSRGPLPHHRVELYKIVTKTLLDTWNQRDESERIDVALAEYVLGALAERLQRSNRILTEHEVKEITRRSMAEFRHRSTNQITDNEVNKFIRQLRYDSGLFVETGQGLFNFMHRSFQEYFVALHLLHKRPEELQQFAVAHYRVDHWYEPLLLAIAYESTRDKPAEEKQASDIIRAIVETNDDYNTVLQRNLLFTATSVADCDAQAIDSELQSMIANRLFNLYGDSSGAGRYRKLQQEIEKAMLRWLRAEPPRSDPEDSWSPLLKTWRIALGNPDLNFPFSQEGAAHLLAAIVPDLHDCPKHVFFALIPPLLQLVNLEDRSLFRPPIITKYFLPSIANPVSQSAQEYAFVALRLLDAHGPAGWLLHDWVQWNERQPELLRLLTRHAYELDYLLTPASLHDPVDVITFRERRTLINGWRSRDPDSLQTQLLGVSNAAHYPLAFLLKHVLDAELAALSSGIPWRDVWDSCLQTEMARGHSATYQVSLGLRLLIWQGDNQHGKNIAAELAAALTKAQEQQTQALIAITNLHLRSLQYLLVLRNVQEQDLRELRDFRDLPDTSLQYLQDLRDLSSLLDLRDIRSLLQVRDMLYQQDLMNKLGLQNFRDLLHNGQQDAILEALYTILEQQTSELTLLTLLCLYSIVALYNPDNPVPSSLEQRLRGALCSFKQRSLSTEHRLLIAAIERRIATPAASVVQATVDIETRVKNLQALNPQSPPNAWQVDEILSACMDTRQVPEELREGYQSSTPQEIAWRLLTQRFDLEADALSVLVQALDHENAIICAASALLLQHCKMPQQQESLLSEAAKKIMGILQDDLLWSRPLDPPNQNIIWRLSDVLFDTLKILARQ